MSPPPPRAPRPSGRLLRLWLTCLALVLGGVATPAQPPPLAAVMAVVARDWAVAAARGAWLAPRAWQARPPSQHPVFLPSARGQLARAVSPVPRAPRAGTELFLTHRALLL